MQNKRKTLERKSGHLKSAKRKLCLCVCGGGGGIRDSFLSSWIWTIPWGMKRILAPEGVEHFHWWQSINLGDTDKVGLDRYYTEPGVRVESVRSGPDKVVGSLIKQDQKHQKEQGSGVRQTSGLQLNSFIYHLTLRHFLKSLFFHFFTSKIEIMYL